MNLRAGHLADYPDRITISRLAVDAHHGVYAEERRAGQRFFIDAELAVDCRDAARGDDLTRTVNYGEVMHAIYTAVANNPVDLIETVAERVATVCLEFPGVQAVTATVHKPSAPVGLPFEDVAVTVARSRAEAQRAGEAVRSGDAQLLSRAGRPTTPTRCAVIALGSNRGDRHAKLTEALARVAALPGVYAVHESSRIETLALTPRGIDETAPRYLNAVATAVVAADVHPQALLGALLAIEADLGRVRAERWGDREIDLDLIALGGLSGTWPDAGTGLPPVTLPHPRAHERAFVLEPWSEIQPDAVLPGHGRLRDLVSKLRREPGERTR